MKISTTTLDQVLPKRKVRGPSNREKTRQEYIEVLNQNLVGQEPGKVVDFELEQDDNALTISNRIHKAAAAVGINILTRRKGVHLFAWIPTDEEWTEYQTRLANRAPRAPRKNAGNKNQNADGESKGKTKGKNKTQAA